MAELVLVRHAQASFAAAEYDQLSPLGERQSRWLGEHFAATGRGFDACITGTLRRHRQTLDGVLAALGAPVPARFEHAGLDEYDFRALVEAFERLEPGHALVRARQAAPADKPAYYRVLRLALQAWAGERLPAPLPETWAGFRARVEAAAARLQELAGSCDRMLAISSGGAMATLLGGRLALDLERIVDVNLQIRNTSVSHFVVTPRRFLLASWNATPHLEAPDRRDSISYG
jgi:broad specificity phosphatase PhoE